MSSEDLTIAQNFFIVAVAGSVAIFLTAVAQMLFEGHPEGGIVVADTGARSVRVEVYKSPIPGRQRWRFRVVRVGNNERLAQGESYRDRADAVFAARLVTGLQDIE